MIATPTMIPATPRIAPNRLLRGESGEPTHVWTPFEVWSHQPSDVTSVAPNPRPTIGSTSARRAVTSLNESGIWMGRFAAADRAAAVRAQVPTRPTTSPAPPASDDHRPM